MCCLPLGLHYLYERVYEANYNYQIKIWALKISMLTGTRSKTIFGYMNFRYDILKVSAGYLIMTYVA